MHPGWLRIGYGYWYGDKCPLYHSDFHSQYHLVEIWVDEYGNETIKALCGTKSEQESDFKTRHYFKNMRFFDLVQKAGLRIDEEVMRCSACLAYRWWAVLRDMVEKIEDERWRSNNGNSG